MADGVAIGRANDDEIRAFARRRCSSEAAGYLYVELADAAPGGAWVARDAGEAVGIAFAHHTDDECFVSELFVEPSFRGRGLGSELLAAACEGSDAPRAGVVKADDAAAWAFAVKRGAGAQMPLLALSGALPREEQLLGLAAGSYRFGVQPIDVGEHGFALDEIDRAVRGTARRADHAVWARRAAGTAFFLQEELVGYGYVWPSGRVGPLAVVSGAYVVQAFAFALISSARNYGASWCSVLLPAANARVARAAIGAGLRVDRTLLAVADAFSGDPSRYAAFNRLLL